MNEQPSTFFYAKDGQRIGPLPMEQLAALTLSGEIVESTLVWNEALTEWKPYSEYAKIVAAGYARCSVSNVLRPISEMVKFGEQYVSAEHRDEFFQRVKQGVPTTTNVVNDPVELDRLLSEQGFNTSVGSIVSRSWNFWKDHFGFSVGVVLVATLIGGVAGQIPFIGLLAMVLLQPHLNAGCLTVLARKARGEEAAFDGLFEPLKLYYGRLALYGLVSSGITILMMAVVFGVVFFTFGAASIFGGEFDESQMSGASIALLVAVIALASMLTVFLLIRMSFAPILIADKGMEFGAAMRLSWRATGMRFWTMLGAGIVLGLLAMLGFLALFIGILLTLPLIYIGSAIAYDDAFGSRGASQ